MDSSLKNVHKHMMTLGCGSLSHANYLAHFTDFVEVSWSELAVLQATHACEIFFKARLAQEHPLLIFESLPKSTSEQFKKGGKLDFNSLVQSGKTIEYSALPERLWAATGFRLTSKQLALYREIGAIRNTIQHFAPPLGEVSLITSRFIFEVIDPFINEHWGLFALNFCEDSEPYEYFVPTLANRGVKFLIPPKLGIGVIDLIKSGSPSYIKSMKAQAKKNGYLP